jgi:hypothetical protein
MKRVGSLKDRLTSAGRRAWGGATVLKEVGNAPKDTFSRFAAVVRGGSLFVIIQSPPSHSPLCNPWPLTKIVEAMSNDDKANFLALRSCSRNPTEIVHNVI